MTFMRFRHVALAAAIATIWSGTISAEKPLDRQRSIVQSPSGAHQAQFAPANLTRCDRLEARSASFSAIAGVNGFWLRSPLSSFDTPAERRTRRGVCAWNCGVSCVRTSDSEGAGPCVQWCP